ncbi:MAG: dCMP deaminase family protein [Candidatus Wildermuthbacteria bacterium]|nr:dCMP deaminase family protein [Candidatus Wildermuthbacteria bacterium]
MDEKTSLPAEQNAPVNTYAGRPTWDEYFMAMAKLVATMATCPKRRVGSVIVKNRRIVATGFNGAPPGLPHCTEAGCLVFPDEGTSCQRVLHSEHNAILQNSGDLEGATLYTIFMPCLNCMKAIISAKIREVIYEQDYPKPKGKYTESKEFASQAGVKLKKIAAIDAISLLSRYS